MLARTALAHITLGDQRRCANSHIPRLPARIPTLASSAGLTTLDSRSTASSRPQCRLPRVTERPSIIPRHHPTLVRSLATTLFAFVLWFRDITTEGTYLGDHTLIVQNGCQALHRTERWRLRSESQLLIEKMCRGGGRSQEYSET
ncbi:hypothetical protein CC85DRAFT_22464 [Cutaneotrichosporon oleaginosum]|uniref:Heme-copper oxidase subunit III family profile domain-containing protein n=1 Tax=Cutaneotrichosporon oleaginosum TaxID=879819 RepID=A0A0J0XBZ7_9TREE|nr:uncharacterized protein CC85DRAFT_22464 [Cutaneotrichosporon oleaginosum]KLT38598.1 hypothetical protein CC85DRAFT_22464 [Cutaneotrichosporon oleaginosum]